MRRDLFRRTIPALGLGLALSWAGQAPGQGRPPNSGSGAGTGTGLSGGYSGSTGTGRESTSGLGTTGTGSESGSTSPLPRLSLPSYGGGLTRPLDRSSFGPVEAMGMTRVEPDLFLDARAVSDPGERALALVRIAQTAVFSKQLDDAHQALFEAGPAALAERDRLVREQRITAIIDGLLRLAEERMSDSPPVLFESPTDDTPAPVPQPPPPPVPAPPTPSGGVAPSPGLPNNNPGNRVPSEASVVGRTPAAALPVDQRKQRLEAALPEWAQAVELAGKLDSATARTEAYFRIVESEAFSSQRLITDPLRIQGGLPDPAQLAPDLRAYTDLLLSNSARHASLIERPIWRDFAAFNIVSNAAASSQFARGFQIARAIAQPEARTDALIRLAEGQALNNKQDEATAAYLEAARAVSQIPQDDPRETLVGVLIDSLISFGRFEDARACVPLYAIPARQLVALEAVAESQGYRGVQKSAREWIARDVPEQYRPRLYRKVNDGMLRAVERDRSKDLSKPTSAPSLGGTR